MLSPGFDRLDDFSQRLRCRADSTGTEFPRAGATNCAPCMSVSSALGALVSPEAGDGQRSSSVPPSHRSLELSSADPAQHRVGAPCVDAYSNRPIIAFESSMRARGGGGRLVPEHETPEAIPHRLQRNGGESDSLSAHRVYSRRDRQPRPRCEPPDMPSLKGPQRWDLAAPAPPPLGVTVPNRHDKRRGTLIWPPRGRYEYQIRLIISLI